MKTVIIAIICLAAGFGLAYWAMPAADPGVSETSSVESGKQLYTCGMHPEIISDEPGLCPICNMKLTPKRDGGNANSGAVRVDPATRQSMGLVTAPASYRSLERSITTFGKVVVPDPREYSITVKVDGWVEKLFVSEVGEEVYRGQPLLEIYSPELVAAQREYLVAVRDNGRDSALSRLASMAEARLRNFDISDDQIMALRETGKVTRTMRLRSPADGFVLEKQVNEGDRVNAQKTLFRIADLTEVWVEASVYEQDLPYIRLGQRAVVTTPGLPSESFSGSINYIAPVLDEGGQAEVRLTLDNTDLRLRPEMYTELSIESSLPGNRLTVPRQAVINSGRRQLVFVADGNDSYEPRTVRTGAVGDDDVIEVTEGLHQGDPVVVSGQFLIDSESRLNEMAGGGAHAGHAGGGSSEMSMVSAKSDQSEHSDHGTMQDDHAMADTTAKDPYDIHTCPMPSHYHVLNYGPGQCPECNMDLVPVSETDNSPVYVCPMPQCKTVSKEPGQCPVCNMNLMEYLPSDTSGSAPAAGTTDESTGMEGGMHEHAEDMTAGAEDKDDPYDVHTCPMPSHYHVLKYGPGQCPECNMDLVPVRETDNSPVYVCPMPRCGSPSQEPGQCSHCNMDLIRYDPEDDS